jgi:hypothetical protein
VQQPKHPIRRDEPAVVAAEAGERLERAGPSGARVDDGLVLGEEAARVKDRPGFREPEGDSTGRHAIGRGHGEEIERGRRGWDLPSVLVGPDHDQPGLGHVESA